MLSTPKRTRIAALALILAGSVSLSACMTATPYQPAVGSGSARAGYSDQQIEGNRFRVSFAGNSLTARETVERYLLYRAAELTLQQGFDYFVLSDRDTEKKTDIVGSPSAWGPPGPWGYWSPSWRFYRGPRYGGWRSWDPFYDDPFWRDRDWDYRTVTQYEAMAEVVMGKGPKPSDNLRAFDAHEVVNRLGPSIQMPTQK